MSKFMGYNKTVLDNGVTVVTDSDERFYSVALGIWVKCGSADEEPENNGVSHFIEHMLFKGTEKRNCADIAMEIDSLGGILNAYTTRETTCYYTKVRKEHVYIALDLLSDIFINSLFHSNEIERERHVILQELSAEEDTPDDYIHDLFSETFWKNSPLARPVIGSVKSISSITRESLLNFMKDNYTPDRIIIAAAGNIDHFSLLKKVSNIFCSIDTTDNKRKDHALHNASSNVMLIKKSLEQVHFCLGTHGIPSNHNKRHSAYILNTVLGSGMSSRLFQKIREKEGLAYSIYSFLTSYENSGLLGVYVGTAPENVIKVCRMIVQEFKRLKSYPLPASDLQMAKGQLEGNIVLGLECSESRLERLASNEMHFGRNIPIEEVIENIESVSSQDILDLSNELFKGETLNMSVLGDIKKGDIKSEFYKLMEAMNS